MSENTIDRNAKRRVKGNYSTKSSKIPVNDVITPTEKEATDTADKASFDAGNRNLREVLNKMSKKQHRKVDKETKRLINDITQKEQDESGPYSLLFDLQPSTLKESIKNVTRSESSWEIFINRCNERLPNVTFDEKPMKEFECSCKSQIIFPVTKTFNTHSRYDLCLQLKSQMNPRIYDTNLSPNDNSLNRTNKVNSPDDSLEILSADQMESSICYLENACTPTVEELPILCDNNESKVSPDCSVTPSTDKTDSNSAVSTIQNDEFERNDFTAPLPRNTDWEKIDKVSKSCDNLTAQKTSFLTTKLLDKSAKSISNFMPSLNSSILDPVSSIAEKTVNLELPLDCKLENRLVVHRIEQTPSPEDLPLDSIDITGEISYNSQFSNSTLHDSQTYSDNKNDYQKSTVISKVSNSFITSITSITSLDGYQGDGEMTRPVSRAAEHSIEPREDVIEIKLLNVPVTRRADPMTDSDFFTESDADGLDDHMHKGDRKAQVIDGALYGGKNSNGNPPLIVNRNDDSCMESSGFYTDFENHRQSPVLPNVIDLSSSPEGSMPSTHSELSQKKVSSRQQIQECMHEESFKPAVVEKDKAPTNTSKQNSLNSEKDVRSNAKSKDEKRSCTLKYKMSKRHVPFKLKTMFTNLSTIADNSPQSTPKTVKMADRRDGPTKKDTPDLKTDYKKKSKVLVCSFSLQASSKLPSPNMKPKSRDMRMRQDVGSPAGSGKSSLHSSQSDVSATHSLLRKPAVNRIPLLRNGKKRDGVAALPPPPARPAPPATRPAPPATRPAPPATRPAPPPARPAPPPARLAPAPQQPPTQAKKNGVVPKVSSAPMAIRARTPHLLPTAYEARHVTTRKPNPRRFLEQRSSTLPNNEEPPRVTAAVGPGTKVALMPVRAPPAAPIQTEQAKALAHATKGVEALGVLVEYLVFRLDALNCGSWRVEAERWRGVAAAERTSAELADHDRQQRAQKDLDTITECLGKISELEMEVSSKEKANARLQAAHVSEVASLASDIKDQKKTIDSLKRQVAESRARLREHGKIERTLRAQLDAARAEIERANTLLAASDTARSVCNTGCNTDPVRCELECELKLNIDEELSTDASKLAAEVRSLRAVLDLKQAEVASLRVARSELNAERERRVVAERQLRTACQNTEELMERAAARQRDADTLREENVRLKDAAARDRNEAARVTMKNEELHYKLMQKTQVVSLLASGGYIQDACTSSASSLRSLSPELPPTPAPASASAPATPPLPAVKGVVKKHDSVSWVLQVEETPLEVASRLARRSSNRAMNSSAPPAVSAGAGAGAGTKRPGSAPPGSPAPSSPAPAASKLFRPGDLDYGPPPPLKESAGEAIYIYNDQY